MCYSLHSNISRFLHRARSTVGVEGGWDSGIVNHTGSSSKNSEKVANSDTVTHIMKIEGGIVYSNASM